MDEGTSNKKGIATVVPFVAALAICLFARVNTIDLTYVPSASMTPTLQVNDRVFALFGNERIKPGDIVTFPDPENKERALIKRVVAVGGETVDIRNGKLFVNEQVRTFPGETGATEQMKVAFPLTLEDDELLCLGDNRQNSADSRMFGPIRKSDVTSVAHAVYWPLEHIRTL